MASTTILSDNGVSSGSAGLKSTAGNDGVLILQTTTSGGTATNAISISNTQVATFSQAPVLPSGSIPQAALAAGVAGNGPAFFAYQSSVQSLTGGSSIKLQLQTELFDTNSNFDNVTNYRFTPTVAGYYQISGSVMIATTTTTTNIQSVLFKNGSIYVAGSLNVATAAAYPQSVFSVLVYFNGSTDYVELYGYTNVTTNTNPYQQNVYLSGAFVRTA